MYPFVDGCSIQKNTRLCFTAMFDYPQVAPRVIWLLLGSTLSRSTLPRLFIVLYSRSNHQTWPFRMKHGTSRYLLYQPRAVGHCACLDGPFSYSIWEIDATPQGYPTSYIQTSCTVLIAEVSILVPLFKYMPSKKKLLKFETKNILKLGSEI